MISRGFTPRAEKIIKIDAQNEAKSYNSELVQSEHLMLAILKDSEGAAFKVIKTLGVHVYDLVNELEDYLDITEGPMFLGELPYAEEAKELLELSGSVALEMGYAFVGSEHIFLAGLMNTNMLFSTLFEESGITAQAFRETIVRILGFGNSGKQNREVKKTPTLDEFTIDLTAKAKAGKLDKVIGREKEIERLIQILNRRLKNNPVLVGHPGVGKTAIVEGLAVRIYNNSVPDVLLGKKVLTLNLGQLVAGTKYRGEFEERIRLVIKELEESPHIILFIDELHTIIGAGSAEGSLDAANLFKPALSRGNIQCIGATTLNEYRKYIEKDSALERRFQPITVEEPSLEEAMAILKGNKNLYEEFHNVQYTDKAVEAAVVLSNRFINERFLPDKAIDLIDEAGSRLRFKKSSKPEEIVEIEKEILSLETKKQAFVKQQLFEECIGIQDTIRELLIQKERLMLNWQKSIGKDKLVVDVEEVTQVVSSITGVPLLQLELDETKKLLHLEDELRKRVIGQEDAVNKVAAAVRRSRLGLVSKKRPMGSFIFLGPTGVGKTELAKTLSSFVLGAEDAMIRIDMSDFMEKHNVSRLVGAPPGYVGYENGGVLTERVRKQPYSVILFDEIEKAHHDFFNILLQILEEGELHDNLGHKVSFRNTMIIMTSNLGARQMMGEATLGFSVASDEQVIKDIKSTASSELKKHFSPEFINRIDDIVVFHPLTNVELKAIIDLIFSEVQDNAKIEHGLKLELKETAKDFIIKKYYDKKYGARPIRRGVQKEIVDKLTIKILSNSISSDSQISIEANEEEIFFNVSTLSETNAPLVEVVAK